MFPLTALLAACGGDGITVVTLQARPAVRAVETLRVDLANANATQAETFTVDGREFPLTFSIETGGRDGTLAITARALDGDDLSVATATGTVEIAGRTDIELMLEPDDFTVNTAFVGDQRLSFRFDSGGRQIAVGPDGTFTIGWSDSCQVVGRCDVFGRRFDVRGAPVGTELAAGTAQFNFNLTNGLVGFEPSLATNADGTTIAAWSDELDLYAVTIDAAGAATAISETSVANGTTPTTPAVAVLPDGRFIVAWTEDAPTPAGTFQVRAVWLDQTGQVIANPVTNTATPYIVSTTVLPDRAPPALATLGDLAEHGIVWRNGSSLRARFYTPAGPARTVGEVAIGQFNDDLIGDPQIVESGDGVAILFGRQTFGGDADTGQLVLRKVSTAGQRVVDAIVARDIAIRPAALATRADGALAATWEACNSDNDGSACGVRLQLFRPTLAAVGAPVFANSTTTNTQIETSVAALPDGAYVATWSDGSQLPPDLDGFSIRARILYPPYDDASGLGARCTASATCGEGNVCLPGSDGDTRCYRACAADRSCSFGGTCTTVGAESGCVF